MLIVKDENNLNNTDLKIDISRSKYDVEILPPIPNNIKSITPIIIYFNNKIHFLGGYSYSYSNGYSYFDDYYTFDIINNIFVQENDLPIAISKVSLSDAFIYNDELHFIGLVNSSSIKHYKLNINNEWEYIEDIDIYLDVNPNTVNTLKCFVVNNSIHILYTLYKHSGILYHYSYNNGVLTEYPETNIPSTINSILEILYKFGDSISLFQSVRSSSSSNYNDIYWDDRSKTWKNYDFRIRNSTLKCVTNTSIICYNSSNATNPNSRHLYKYSINENKYLYLLTEPINSTWTIFINDNLVYYFGSVISCKMTYNGYVEVFNNQQTYNKYKDFGLDFVGTIYSEIPIINNFEYLIAPSNGYLQSVFPVKISRYNLLTNEFDLDFGECSLNPINDPNYNRYAGGNWSIRYFRNKITFIVTSYNYVDERSYISIYQYDDVNNEISLLNRSIAPYDYNDSSVARFDSSPFIIYNDEIHIVVSAENSSQTAVKWTRHYKFDSNNTWALVCTPPFSMWHMDNDPSYFGLYRGYVRYNNKLYFFIIDPDYNGGYYNCIKIYEFNPSNNKWTWINSSTYGNFFSKLSTTSHSDQPQDLYYFDNGNKVYFNLINKELKIIDLPALIDQQKGDSAVSSVDSLRNIYLLSYSNSKFIDDNNVIFTMGFSNVPYPNDGHSKTLMKLKRQNSYWYMEKANTYQVPNDAELIDHNNIDHLYEASHNAWLKIKVMKQDSNGNYYYDNEIRKVKSIWIKTSNNSYKLMNGWYGLN